MGSAVSGQHYTDWSEYEMRIIMNVDDPSELRCYELMRDYTISLPEYFEDVDKIHGGAADDYPMLSFLVNFGLPIVDWDFVRLDQGGILTVKRGFCWDGPSYPWRDHAYFNYRSSMIHDALYTLMRLEYMVADHHYQICTSDLHSPPDQGDYNREMADNMIYMIALEDGQDRTGNGGQNATMDYNVIRIGGACRTFKSKYVDAYQFHVSELTGYASSGQVELNWKRANHAARDPKFSDHFIPYVSLKVLRDGVEIAEVHPSVTSYTDPAVVNGTAYCYQIVPDTGSKNQYDRSNDEHVVPMSGAGNALKLDGVDDFVTANTVANDLDYQIFGSPMSPITIEAWVYPEAQSGLPKSVLSFSSVVGFDLNMIRYDGDNQKFCYYDNETGYTYSGTESPPEHWYHLALTIDMAGQGHLFIDGEEQATFETNVKPTYGSRFTIGQAWDATVPTRHFKGMVDEARVWTVARTQAQIQADMDHPLRGDEDGLVALWHFDEPNDLFVETGFSMTPPHEARKGFDATVHANDGMLVGYDTSDVAFVVSGAMDEVTDVNDGIPGSLPHRFEIAQNYPNPFNPVTTIKYSVPSRSLVSIEVFNIVGRKVRTLVNTSRAAGNHIVTWDGNDSDGQSVSTGVYLYRLQAGDFSETKKMLLLK
jgi:hypothetical protein